MRYCPNCKKVVNTNKTKTKWNGSSKFRQVVETCAGCYLFLAMYLEEICKNKK